MRVYDIGNNNIIDTVSKLKIKNEQGDATK